MRQSHFWTLLDDEFGSANAGVIASSLELPGLNKTAEQALAAGVDPRIVWQAVCELHDNVVRRKLLPNSSVPSPQPWISHCRLCFVKCQIVLQSKKLYRFLTRFRLNLPIVTLNNNSRATVITVEITWQNASQPAKRS